MTVSTPDSLRTRVLAEVISASILLHAHQAKARERALRSEQGTSLTLQQFMLRAFRNAERGLPAVKKDHPPAKEDGDDSETGDEGWETDSDGVGIQEEPLLPDPEDLEE